MLASTAQRLRNLRWFLRPRREVSVGRFDTSAGRWVDADIAATAECDEFTVATYNIWFDDFRSRERYEAIADVLAAHTPDVMVFQEVTPAALQAFSRQRWIQQNYYCAAAVGAAFGNYGLLVLSRLPITRATYTRLPTRLERGFLTVQCMVNDLPLTVCCIHLDSGKAAAPLRVGQLHRVFHTLGTVKDVVAAGDFNMRDKENAHITAPWVDVWPTLRPDDDGFTEDTSINLMRWDSKPKARQVRFDRILVKGAAWAPASIELLGREPISAQLPRVFPSDHFGVLCRLVKRQIAVPDLSGKPAGDLGPDR